MTGFEAGLLRLSGVLVPAALAPWAVALVGILAGWWQPEGRWVVYLVGTALAVAGAERILRKEINAQVHADLLANLKQEL